MRTCRKRVSLSFGEYGSRFNLELRRAAPCVSMTVGVYSRLRVPCSMPIRGTLSSGLGKLYTLQWGLAGLLLGDTSGVLVAWRKYV